MRDGFDDSIWVSLLKKQMLDNPGDYVVPDVRFRNEQDMIRELGGEIWRVQRGDVPEWYGCAMLDNTTGGNLMESYDIHSSEYKWIDLNNKFGDKEKETIEIDDAEDDDDMSAISQLSQSELVARFKKLQKEMKKGSAPNDQDNKSHTGNGDNNDEDSDSSSSGSSVNSGMSGVSVSSDSSVESVTPPNAAPSG